MLQGSGGACILGLTWENKVCHFCHEGYWWWWHTWIVCLQYLFNINFAASETMPPDRSCSGSNRPGLAHEIFHVFAFIARDGLRNFSCVCACVCKLRKFPNPFLLCRRQRATSKPSVFTHQYWVPYRWGDWKTYLHAPLKKKWFQSKTNLAWGMCFWWRRWYIQTGLARFLEVDFVPINFVKIQQKE